MKPLFFTLVAALGLGTISSTAQAEQVCMTADEMQSALIDWYGEEPVTEPTDDNRQLWASNRTGTWTMVKTLADGNACVVAQGEDWILGTDGSQQLALNAD